MKQTHLAFAIITALSLAACGGSSSGGNSTNHTHVDGNDSHSTNTVDPDNKKPTTPTTGGSPVSGSSSSGGFNNATTPIETATIIASAETADAITDSIKEQITLSRDGEVNLADTVENVQDSNSYDIGIHGIKKGDLKTEEFNQLSAVKAVADTDFATNGKALYVRDPAVTGWKYQTFGHAFENNTESKGFTSIGKAQDIPEATATPEQDIIYYSGVAVGQTGNSEVASQVNANVDLGQKTLFLNVYNSKIAENNTVYPYYAGVKDASQYDFTEKDIQWNSSEKAFKKEAGSNKVEARLYGPNAAEIGGTYQRDTLEGAFGAKKIDPPAAPTISHAKRGGNGAPAIWFDGKFKAMNSLNDKNTDSSGKFDHKNLEARWDELTIKAPNTLFGNRDKNNTRADEDNVKVKDTAVWDFRPGYTQTEVIIQLANNKEVVIDNLDKDVTVHKKAVEDGEYIAQSVHLFGTRNVTRSTDGDNFGDGILNAAYVYGTLTTNEQFSKIQAGKFKYSGDATFSKHDDSRNVERGTSEFEVQFAGGNKGTVNKGTIVLPSTGTFEWTDPMEIKGTSFATKKFSNSSSFDYKKKNNDTGIFDEIEATDPQIRGRFYGKSGNFIGGTFYNHDGVGTFFSSKGDKI